jgi:hypothetical protein
MSGRSISLYGSRRGYLLTDGASVSDVAAMLDASPPKESRRMYENHVDMVNRNPHLIRANILGTQCYLVLYCLHGIEQAVLVEKQRGTTSRKMTCVPIRFDSDLHQTGVVFSGVIARDPYPCLILEDVVRIGGGHLSTAGAWDRAVILYDLLHEKHRADPFCQPFPVKCARFLTTDICESRSIWRNYPHQVGSLTLCSLVGGYPDLWLHEATHARNSAPHQKRNNNRARPNSVVEKMITVMPMDAPDVYKVLDNPGGTLVVKSLADSKHMLEAKIKSQGSAFEVQAKWDTLAMKWTLSVL